MTGFKFKNQHSNDFGIVMRSVNRTLLPEVRQVTETIPGRDGSYDFSDGSLNDRIVEIDCSFISDDIFEMKQRARQMAAWLYTPRKVPLIFDDEPYVQYYARISNQIDFEQTFELGVFTLQFTCDPYAERTENAEYGGTENPEDVLWSDPYTMDETSVTFGGTPYQYSITTTPNTFQIDNYGTAPISPEIQVVGYCDDFSITINGDTFVFNGVLNNEELWINNDKMTVKLVDGTNKLKFARGKFLTLEPGFNDVVVDGTNVNFSIYFVFNPRYY